MLAIWYAELSGSGQVRHRWREHQALGLDPLRRESKLTSKRLNENHVREVLDLLRACPVVTLPTPKDLVQTRGCLIMYRSGILSLNVEWLGNEIGGMLANEEVGVKARQIDLFREILTIAIS